MQRRSTKRKYSGADPASWKRLKYNPKSTVSTLTRKVNKILSEQERKNLDVTASLITTANTATIVQLSSVPQGDDAVSRDGRKISKVSSQMRYKITSTGTNLASPFRIIVLHDMQSNGVSPVAADILTAPTNVLSPLTLDFKERFRVIHDNYMTLGKGDFPMLQVANEQSHFPGQYFYKFKDDMAQSEFGGIGNIPTTGAVVMLILTQAANTVDYYHRLRFTDS